jgi:hypothetical protein
MEAEMFETTKKLLVGKARGGRALTRALVALGAAVLASGCAVDVGEPLGAGGGPAESTFVDTAALTACAPSVTAYDVFGGSATGPATSSHICWVTQFRETTTNYKPHMIVQQSGGFWTATGWGQMMCATQCAFNSNGGSSDVRWLSQDFGAYKYAAPHTGQLVAQTAMWNGDAMNILSGMLHYGGSMTLFERGLTVWSSTGVTIKLRAEPYGNATSSAIGVYGYSFFVGVPSTGHVVKVSKEYTAQAGGEAIMIGKDSGICAFTRLNGFTDSYPAMILRTSTNWKLIASSGFTTARCFYYDQSQ